MGNCGSTPSYASAVEASRPTIRTANPNYREDYDYIFKMLLVGDSATGKSSLLLRFVDNSFESSFISTIGVDFKIYNMKLSDGSRAKLQIWDTAGQERFRTITSSYYRGCNCVMVVYDVTDRKSFANVERWMNEVDRNARSDAVRALVGNKTDLDDRQVTYIEGQEKAREMGVRFYETSAKQGANVAAMFTEMAEAMRPKDA